MNPWFNLHTQAIKLVLARMQQNKLSSLLISIVFGLTISLPSLFYVGVDNLAKLTHHMQEETEISLFLTRNSNAEDHARISKALASNPAIQQFHLVTKEQAWQQLQARSDSDAAVDQAIQQLNTNPLPDAFFVQAKSTNAAILEALTKSLQAIPNVEQAVLNAAWVKRLSTLVTLSKKVIFIIALLLGAVLLVIVGNTIRMQIITQKDEIEVSHLMGATPAFIRLPFLYSGIMHGLIGGLLTLIMMAVIIQMFNAATANMAALYNTDFHLNIMDLHLSALIVCAAMCIGWLGAYLAVSRSIAAVQLR